MSHMNTSVDRDHRNSSVTTDISRRDANLRFIMFTAGTSLFGSRAFAQQSIETSRFDLHHHFFPPVAKKRYGPFIWSHGGGTLLG